MTKSDVIAALAEKEGLQHKEASDIVNLVLDGFTDTLKKDDVLNSGDSAALQSGIMIHILEGIPRPESR